jgi:hypothetical protein
MTNQESGFLVTLKIVLALCEKHQFALCDKDKKFMLRPNGNSGIIYEFEQGCRIQNVLDFLRGYDAHYKETNAR